MEWSDEKVFDLITLYEKNPCLYNIKSKDYHNRRKKRLVIMKFAAELQTTELDISKKLKYLRSQFGDELKKSSFTKTGMATEEMYPVKWKFYGALSFLQKHVNVKRPCIASNSEVETEIDEEAISNSHWPSAVKYGQLDGSTESAKSSVTNTLKAEFIKREAEIEEEGISESNWPSDVQYGQFDASTESVKSPVANLLPVKAEVQSDSSSTESSPILTNAKTSNKHKRRHSPDLQGSAIDKSLVAMQQYFTACAVAMSQSQPKSSADDDDSDMLFARMIGTEVKKIRSSVLKRTLKKQILDAVFQAQSMDAEEQDQNG